MTSSILEKVINLFDMFSRVTKDNNKKKIPQTYTEVCERFILPREVTTISQLVASAKPEVHTLRRIFFIVFVLLLISHRYPGNSVYTLLSSKDISEFKK